MYEQDDQARKPIDKGESRKDVAYALKWAARCRIVRLTPKHTVSQV
jgi:hypothetical protein